jgi:hypothetical protein
MSYGITHRTYNVGESDYSKYKYQVWDIWRDFKLDPWEADIVKRILRKKDGEENDLKKVKHILEEMICQAENECCRLNNLIDKIRIEYNLNEFQIGWLGELLMCKQETYLNRLYWLKRNIKNVEYEK